MMLFLCSCPPCGKPMITIMSMLMKKEKVISLK